MIPPGPRMAPDAPDGPDVLAAEYVMGAMTSEEALTFEAQMLGDAALRDSTAFWRVRLAPLADCVPTESPPPELWNRLALAAGLPVPNAQMVTRKPRKPRTVLGRFWQNTPFWRGLAAASTAVAAGLALYVLAPPQQASEPMLAALSPAGAPGAMFLIRVEPNGTGIVQAVGTPNVPVGRSLQLWTVASDTAVPVPLGLVPASGRGRLRIASAPGTRILVSLEPFGGSPTGKPTGPVVYAGQLAQGL